VRAAPILVPTLGAVAIFLAWIPGDGGQPITQWGPGTLGILALLTMAVVAVPLGAVPTPVRLAVGLLVAFTAWSYLSILWADDQGAALEGADRTLLYAAVFALFALWPQRLRGAALVAGAWTLGMGVLALVTLLHLGTADAPRTLFHEDRLIDPAGYANAAAALWLMPLWPAVTFAASPRVPWALRGVLAGVAVLFLDVALLSQSRGSVLAIPACLILFVAFVPGRLRHLAVLVPIGLAAAAAAPTVLDVGPAALDGTDAALRDAVHSCLRVVLVASVAAGLVVGAAAAWERLRPPSPATAARVARAWGMTVVVLGVLGLAGALVVAKGPVRPIDHAWKSFKGGYEDNGSGNRLTAGLGSNRYDFYRVGLDVFADHPVAGVGADNYFEDYLVRGRSPETPRYPHNLALRTLSETGLIGTALLLGALGAALVAVARALRRADPLRLAVAGGSVMAFAYWVVHGMTDWFWEWAGLGAPAFAMLGLACALAPRPEPAEGAAPARPLRPAVVAPVAVVLLLGALAVAGPWLAQRDIDAAGRVFATRPFESYDRLDRAADLDPLGDRARLLEGSIALRYGDLPRARQAFTAALARNPRGQYATLELGAIASAQGRPAQARDLVARAVALAPRDPVARDALGVLRSGGALDVAVLNARILERAQAVSRG
jgi:hypothetical protein